MSMMSHFETLAPGMKAKLDPKYRILKSYEDTDYSELIRELLQSNHNTGLSSTKIRKANGSLSRGADRQTL